MCRGNTDWQVAKKLVDAPELGDFFSQWKEYPLLKSFIHLHLGFRGDGLPASHCEKFPAQWGVFNDWSDLEAPRNAVLVSCPSMQLGSQHFQPLLLLLLLLSLLSLLLWLVVMMMMLFLHVFTSRLFHLAWLQRSNRGWKQWNFSL